MASKNKKVVHIVFCVDTEGPLFESLDAKFDRLYDLYGIDNIDRTVENYNKLKDGDIDLGGIENEVVKTLSGHLVNYNETWSQIDRMLYRATSSEFRNKMIDSYGRGWVYNWFILDHVGYEYNPRRRDIGYHNIFDHYREYIDKRNCSEDSMQWHFHPMSTYHEAHRCATSYVNSPELYQILCRKIIERQWFPSAFRAGFQTERPDSNWFLEQWIPFDISNMSLDDDSELDNTIDFRNGRSGDWRLAPSDWSIYNPHPDYYQLKGNCRRFIARALNILNRIASINEYEMTKAFERANSGFSTLMGIATHDFRDLTVEVDFLRQMINKVSKEYPDVEISFSNVIHAFKDCIWDTAEIGNPVDLQFEYRPKIGDDAPTLKVVTKSGKVFGPQPFLSIETTGRRFIHDNLDFDVSLNKWHYAFHADTLPIDDVKRIGVAANDQYGNTCVKVIDFKIMDKNCSIVV